MKEHEAVYARNGFVTVTKGKLAFFTISNWITLPVVIDTKFHSNLYRNLLNETLEKNGLRESSFKRFNEERSNNSLGISILKSLFCADIKNSHLDFFSCVCFPRQIQADVVESMNISAHRNHVKSMYTNLETIGISSFVFFNLCLHLNRTACNNPWIFLAGAYLPLCHKKKITLSFCLVSLNNREQRDLPLYV